MKLLTKALRQKLPALYGQAWKGDEAIAHLKFFTPDAQWTWYATEGSPVIDENTGEEVDFEFFGLVEGRFTELGYFTLRQLETAKGPKGLPIERDLHWEPKPLKAIKTPKGGAQ